MKLTAKIVLVFVLGVFVVTSLYAYIAIQHEVQQFESDSLANAQRIGSVMEEMITIVYREHGEEGVVRMVNKRSDSEQHMRLRWVQFDAPPGDPRSPSIDRERVQSLIVNRTTTIAATDPDGNKHLDAYWPITMADNHSGGLEISRPLAELDEHKWEAIYEALTMCAAMVLMSGLIATLVGMRFVGRPLKQLIEKTRRIGKGDLSGPLRLASGDELGELAGSVNDMCEQLADSQERIREEAAARLVAVDQLRHADRLRTVGQLAAGVAHELGTPLNVVAGRAGLIASGRLSQDEVTKSAATIRAESDRMTTIIRQLLDFARRNTPQRVDTDLRHIARQTMELLTALAEKNNVSLTLECEEAPFPIQLDVGQMQQVFSNLIVNAIQSMPDGGPVTVSLARAHDVTDDHGSCRQGEFYRLAVEDGGVGISAAEIDQVFEPFFTTKDVGEGTGLGLSISFGIVQEHGGWIDVNSEVGHGSCLSVYLPTEDDACRDES